MAGKKAHIDKEEEPFDLALAMEHVGDMLRPHFAPAKDSTDSDQMLTTEQLVGMINDHQPDLVPPSRMRDVMHGLGFSEGLEGLTFVWYMKAVKGA